jgi:ubiquinone/menaquinone biosynthesis C-methylase UbiE
MQWGHGYRVLHERAWTEAYRVLKPGGAVILNIKDHIRGGALIHVSAWHIATLQALGLRLVEIETVPASMLPRRDTSRLGVAHEYLFTLSKPVRFSAATMA